MVFSPSDGSLRRPPRCILTASCQPCADGRDNCTGRLRIAHSRGSYSPSSTTLVTGGNQLHRRTVFRRTVSGARPITHTTPRRVAKQWYCLEITCWQTPTRATDTPLVASGRSVDTTATCWERSVRLPTDMPLVASRPFSGRDNNTLDRE